MKLVFLRQLKIKIKKKINFFYLGKKNNWQNLLDEKIEIKVKKAFNNEMKELNYI